jgi:multicomponent Na+:H+ antiporter subunit D
MFIFSDTLATLAAALLPFFVIMPVLMAVFMYITSTLSVARWVAITSQALAIIPSLLLLITAMEQPVIVRVGGYDGFLGIVLRADPLAALMVLLTSVIFFAVGVSTMHSPLAKENKLYMFLFFLLQGALMGLFLTRDFFNIFVLVEVTTVVLTIMLMYDRGKRNLFAGMTFIMVNIVVMQFYLFGLGYLYMVVGVLDMEAAAAVIETLPREQLLLPYALIMTSIASKCSLLPMMTWLPKIQALTGARFTIAALMSGLQIKSGIYMFIRVQDVFGWPTEDFFMAAGILTAAAGIVLALAQKDIRLMLAYSTIAQVGLIITGLTLQGPYSTDGAVMHIVNHALFKAALFLCASQLAYAYRTTDITKMRGLWRAAPVLGVANALAVAGFVGAPLMNGSISKYFLMAGTGGWLEIVLIAINLGTLLVFAKYCAVFFGKPAEGLRRADNLRVGVALVLGVGCLALGVGGVAAFRFLFDPFATFSMASYIEKAVIFAVSAAVAALAYKFVISRAGFLAPLSRLSVSFATIIVSIGCFFAVLLAYVSWVM